MCANNEVMVYDTSAKQTTTLEKFTFLPSALAAYFTSKVQGTVPYAIVSDGASISEIEVSNPSRYVPFLSKMFYSCLIIDKNRMPAPPWVFSQKDGYSQLLTELRFLITVLHSKTPIMLRGSSAASVRGPTMYYLSPDRMSLLKRAISRGGKI